MKKEFQRNGRKRAAMERKSVQNRQKELKIVILGQKQAENSENMVYNPLQSPLHCTFFQELGLRGSKQGKSRKIIQISRPAPTGSKILLDPVNPVKNSPSGGAAQS